jgi:hypothetical protein
MHLIFHGFEGLLDLASQGNHTGLGGGATFIVVVMVGSSVVVVFEIEFVGF